MRHAIGLVTFALALTACDDDEKTTVGRVETEAPSGMMEGQNAEQNCMVCHFEGNEKNIPVFTLAGTILKEDGTPQYEATINLYLRDSNTLSTSLKTDFNGNFYTTDKIVGIDQFSGVGLDVEVVTPNNTKMMLSSTTSGECNDCHGDTVPTVRID